ncbi:hypothetical protein CH254_23505 [Rhodococcus sp. 06-412-2C]|uniref:hypothetical protein n=1 Tax=unclassified Rhodococcus (in: high G+C Gram-positive bacteria) TaxID=192944 RepID=UPI000B9B7866|nr:MULTISPECIES: hypothetical protein [unclassified Rhodococcus (in: high G+C Gram-positive bacteria)]OZC83862.1 hypothetical protein CH254_23505 [Rhodococcus sp. 06-412-2C]OZC94050.1 hypothetical protein CH279_21590 [Rhodococcus sp. 06-412-2B]
MDERNWARWAFIWPLVFANAYGIFTGTREGGSWFTVLYAIIAASLIALILGGLAYYAGTIAIWSTGRLFPSAPLIAKAVWFAALTAAAVTVPIGAVLGTTRSIEATPEPNIVAPILIISAIAFVGSLTYAPMALRQDLHHLNDRR